jgi:hypothetical protein
MHCQQIACRAGVSAPGAGAGRDCTAEMIPLAVSDLAISVPRCN